MTLLADILSSLAGAFSRDVTAGLPGHGCSSSTRDGVSKRGRGSDRLGLAVGRDDHLRPSAPLNRGT